MRGRIPRTAFSFSRTLVVGFSLLFWGKAMANELTINASLEYEDSVGNSASAEIVNKLVTLTTTNHAKFTQTVGTLEEALLLGDITTRGYVMIINRDTTNFVNVKVATSGAIFAKLFPGEVCLLRLGSGAQSPYVIADTAACKIEVLLIEV